MIGRGTLDLEDRQLLGTRDHHLFNLLPQVIDLLEAQDRRVLELLEPIQDVPGELARYPDFIVSICRLEPFAHVMMCGVPLISNVLNLVLGMGRQEELEQLLEGLVETLQDVDDSNVAESVLEQDEVAVSAFPVS